MFEFFVSAGVAFGMWWSLGKPNVFAVGGAF